MRPARGRGDAAGEAGVTPASLARPYGVIAASDRDTVNVGTDVPSLREDTKMAIKDTGRVSQAGEEQIRRVGVRELKERTSEVVRHVRENHETVDITFRGEIVAQLVPVAGGRSLRDRMAREERRQELAAVISLLWPKGVSAVDAIRDQRDDGCS